MQNRSLIEYNFDGRIALIEIIRESSYKTVEQAVASLTLFSHPETVIQSGNRNVFPIIRASQYKNEKRGEYSEIADFGKVMLDDNKGPTDTLIWANRISRNNYCDVQFCHIWDNSYDVSLYSNLANICIMPAFLAKLSDTDQNIKSLLRYRAFEIYQGFKSIVDIDPQKPRIYDELNWAGFMPPVKNLEQSFREAMKTKPKDRTTQCAKEIGWLFSDFKPDSKL
jgi:hypothetical protein